MPTESISHNFVLETEEQIENFVKALEKAEKDKLKREKKERKRKKLVQSKKISSHEEEIMHIRELLLKKLNSDK